MAEDVPLWEVGQARPFTVRVEDWAEALGQEGLLLVRSVGSVALEVLVASEGSVDSEGLVDGSVEGSAEAF